MRDMTATTALLMVDMQNMYLKENQPAGRLGWPPIWRFEEVVEECQMLLATARHRDPGHLYPGRRPTRPGRRHAIHAATPGQHARARRAR